MGKKFSDEDVISLFQDSFHVVSKKAFWSQLRAAVRVDKFQQAEFKVEEHGEVGFRGRPLADDQEANAATFFRKYISGSEPVYLADVLAAGKMLGTTDQLDEASAIFEQLIDKKWRFRVKDGKAVGLFLSDGTPVVWGQDKSLRLRECEEVGLSLQDFMEVTFNEEMFHAFVTNRNEEVRAVVRTVGEPLRKYLSNVGLAGTLYAAIILHAEFGKRSAWLCDESCQEFAAERSEAGLSTPK
ncbi:hypothetical protein [Arthrobacter pigmenti]